MAIKFTDGISASQTVIFETIVCCECKVPFMVTSNHRKRLVEDKTTFFCPNGHRQSYCKNNCDIEKEKLNAEIAKTKKQLESVRELNSSLLDDREELKQTVRELRKKECPSCGKKYIDLKTHMRKAHNRILSL